MKITSGILKEKKIVHEPIVMLTCYDYPTACIIDKCGIDVILVGDSVGTNILGYPDIKLVTINDMVHHIGAVSRGTRTSFILGDLPFCACTNVETVLNAAHTFIAAGADGVKLEASAHAVELIAALAHENIAICGHIGYTPQTKIRAEVVGKDLESAKALISEAIELERAGAFMIVLELIPAELAHAISMAVSIPTIGIGAGAQCDGQVQVINDIAGLSQKIYKHASAFGNVAHEYSHAATEYARTVRNKTFPSSTHSAHLSQPLAAEIKSWTLASN